MKKRFMLLVALVLMGSAALFTEAAEAAERTKVKIHYLLTDPGNFENVEDYRYFKNQGYFDTIRLAFSSHKTNNAVSVSLPDTIATLDKIEPTKKYDFQTVEFFVDNDDLLYEFCSVGTSDVLAIVMKYDKDFVKETDGEVFGSRFQVQYNKDKSPSLREYWLPGSMFFSENEVSWSQEYGVVRGSYLYPGGPNPYALKDELWYKNASSQPYDISGNATIDFSKGTEVWINLSALLFGF